VVANCYDVVQRSKLYGFENRDFVLKLDNTVNSSIDLKIELRFVLKLDNAGQFLISLNFELRISAQTNNDAHFVI
jgi:hypothetical protein